MKSEPGDGGPEMRALRVAARDQDAELDPRWRALAEGRLSDDEVAALKEEAQRTEEGRLLWDIYRPFDADEKKRVFAGVHERMQQQKQRRPANDVVQSIRPFFTVKTIFATAGAAIAATLAPLYFLATALDPSWVGARGPDRQPPPVVLSTPDTEFSAGIDPNAKEKLVLRGALLVREADGSRRAWDPRPNPAGPDNVIHIAGTKKSVFPCVPPGVWDMVVAVGKEGENLTEAQILAGSTRSYKVLRRRVVLEGSTVDEKGNRCAEKAP